MIKAIRSIAVAATVLLAAAGISSAAAAPADTARSTYIVQFKSAADVLPEVANARAAGAVVRSVYKFAINGMSADLTAGQAAAMRANPRVKSMFADVKVTIADTTQTSPTWGLDRIDQRNLPLDSGYTYAANGSGVVAYVFDTGLSTNAPDLTGRILAGQNFMPNANGSTNPNDTTDCHGHGTHVSGTIAGTTWGVAKGAQIMPLRILGCTGSGSSTAYFDAINWVIQQHTTEPAVANFSIGFGATYTSVNDAIVNLINDGIVVAAAAGNSGLDACTNSPGSTPAALTAGATDRYDTKASWSNYGTCVDVFAPGVSITSMNLTGGTAVMSGTSMATPHVTGLAAVIWSANSGFTTQQVSDKLVADSTPGVVVSAGAGSPNLLIYEDRGPVTPPADAAPAVTTNPSNVTVNAGATASFSAAASGSPVPSVQWQVSTNGGSSWSNIGGATSTTYSVATTAGMNGYKYQAVFSNGVGSPVTTTAATLTVNSINAPSASTLTSAVSNKAGQMTLRWTLGSNGGASLTGQTVRVYSTATSWTSYAVSATSTGVTITGLKKGTQYTFSVFATNSAGTSPESNQVTATTRLR